MKLSRRENQSPPSSIGVRNEWSCLTQYSYMPSWCEQRQIFVQNFLAHSDTRTYCSTFCDLLPYAPAIKQVLFCLGKCTIMLQCESWNQILSVLFGSETRFRMYSICLGYTEMTGSSEHVDDPDL